VSVVTDVLLFTLDEEHAALALLHTWCDEHADGQRLRQLSTGQAGGRKAFGCNLWAMCGNYFPVPEFVAYFKTLTWEMPQCVVLVVDHEEPEATQVIRPGTWPVAEWA
jgi:hypothetical protein